MGHLRLMFLVKIIFLFHDFNHASLSLYEGGLHLQTTSVSIDGLSAATVLLSGGVGLPAGTIAPSHPSLENCTLIILDCCQNFGLVCLSGSS